jgi:hypothetical protein
MLNTFHNVPQSTTINNIHDLHTRSQSTKSSLIFTLNI